MLCNRQSSKRRSLAELIQLVCGIVPVGVGTGEVMKGRPHVLPLHGQSFSIHTPENLGTKQWNVIFFDI